MRTLTEQDIRTRAYRLWRAAGEPNKAMDAFWYKAEKELLEERTKDKGRSGRSDIAARRVARRRRHATVTSTH
ncbi:hypothetical protein AS156_03700 [Bradyrhizobium macuxiense]|uniref:DUF2934 family protein n=1 Tax=Bradyrhizobium macuxiense TaxID=1755647 RepID=A0A109JX84_9BRAD|nr:hypothetical protein AS156_03700 [Bradyrhizobium macuxiense]